MPTEEAYLPKIISRVNKEHWSLYVFKNFRWKETLHYKSTLGCSQLKHMNQILQSQTIPKGVATSFKKLKIHLRWFHFGKALFMQTFCNTLITRYVGIRQFRLVEKHILYRFFYLYFIDKYSQNTQKTVLHISRHSIT